MISNSCARHGLQTLTIHSQCCEGFSKGNGSESINWAPKVICHPERNLCCAKRSRHEVERPLPWILGRHPIRKRVQAVTAAQHNAHFHTLPKWCPTPESKRFKRPCSPPQKQLYVDVNKRL